MTAPGQRSPQGRPAGDDDQDAGGRRRLAEPALPSGLRAARLRGLLRRDPRPDAVDADGAAKRTTVGARRRVHRGDHAPLRPRRPLGVPGAARRRALLRDERARAGAPLRLGGADGQPARGHPAAAGAGGDRAARLPGDRPGPAAAGARARAPGDASTSWSPTAPSSPSPRTGAAPDCGLPVQDRFRFRPTRQPVVLDLWPDRSPQPADVFTTIGNWRQDWRDVTYEGERYTWSKHHEFLKYLDLPQRSGQAFELALSSCEPAERADARDDSGWRVRDGAGGSRADIDGYRDYIGASRGSSPSPRTRTCVCAPAGSAIAAPPTSLPAGRSSPRTPGSAAPCPQARGYSASARSTRPWKLRRRSTPTTRATPMRRASWPCEHFGHEVVLPTDAGRAGGRAGREGEAAQAAAPSSRLRWSWSRCRAGRRPCRAPRLRRRSELRSSHTAAHRRSAPTAPASSSSPMAAWHSPACASKASLPTPPNRDFELIVVDNGSADGTPDLPREAGRARRAGPDPAQREEHGIRPRLQPGA